MSVISNKAFTAIGKSNLGDAELALISQQLATLSVSEREQLSQIVQQLIKLDESLAEIHLCLPVLQIVFYRLDVVSENAVSLPLWEIQAMLEATTAQKVRPK